jgi:hypothetical protein
MSSNIQNVLSNQENALLMGHIIETKLPPNFAALPWHALLLGLPQVQLYGRRVLNLKRVSHFN